MNCNVDVEQWHELYTPYVYLSNTTVGYHGRAWHTALRASATLIRERGGQRPRAPSHGPTLMKPPLVLGIETSCDETSAAILRGDTELLGHRILTQDIHEVYGGVVPELAARAHLRVIEDVVDSALTEAGVELRDLDAIGATAGPGLIGALLVGLTWA